MGTSRFLGLILVFVAAATGWLILGRTLADRTESLDNRLSAEMDSLWGPQALVQPAPFLARDPQTTAPSDRGEPSGSDIRAAIRHEHRNKGLLWYSTFTVDFEGTYALAPPTAAARDAQQDSARSHFVFPLPQGARAYDALTVRLDDTDLPLSPSEVAAGRIVIPLDRTAPHTVTVRYTTSGRDYWLYAPTDLIVPKPADEDSVFAPLGPPSRLRDFALTVDTSFRDIDYPKGTRSPTAPAAPVDTGGMRAQWSYDHAVTAQAMGIAMPHRTNAGPIVERMSLFAPVSLLFFFCTVFTVVVLRGIPLHPMHFLFVAGGFFAFHILLAYVAEEMDIHLAFWISALVSVLLVVSYMRLAAGMKFAVLVVGAAQLVYLIGFSYAFFWVGKTGLTITIGAVLTLFVLMQATGRVNWHGVFAPREDAPPFRIPPPLPVRNAPEREVPKLDEDPSHP